MNSPNLTWHQLLCYERTKDLYSYENESNKTTKILSIDKNALEQVDRTISAISIGVGALSLNPAPCADEEPLSILTAHARNHVEQERQGASKWSSPERQSICTSGEIRVCHCH